MGLLPDRDGVFTGGLPLFGGLEIIVCRPLTGLIMLVTNAIAAVIVIIVIMWQE